MKARITRGCVTVLLTLAAVLPASSREGKEAFTLHRAVPADAFLCVVERRNPERAWLRAYWGEVFEALQVSGVLEDEADIFGRLIGAMKEDQAAEVKRLKDRACTLLKGVRWSELDAKEFLFTERWVPLPPNPDEAPRMFMPDMVWAFRGRAEGAAKNYEGLAAILEALVEEVDRAAGAEILQVRRAEGPRGKRVSVNLLERLPLGRKLPLSVALRGDVILIGLGEALFRDVLALMDGDGKVERLADTPRFQQAFAGLPPAEDSLAFFDMQSMVQGMRVYIESVIHLTSTPNDVYVNAAVPPEVNGFHKEAMSAYRRGDLKEALALEVKAHEQAPENSLLLYNLACFNARLGNREAALEALERAVKAGFYAPRKIAGEADLASLRDDPKYKAVLDEAGKQALQGRAPDVAVHCAREGEVFRLRMQVKQAYEKKDYEQALEIARQAYALAPADSQVLYILACLHARLGHEEEGLAYLERAAKGGFYCPEHMAKDPDLAGVRDDPRYRAALEAARSGAAKELKRRKEESLAVAKRIIDRIADAVGILDYTASVDTTEGYSTASETYAALVPDAESRPVYPVFARKAEAGAFHRFLPVETESFSVGTGIDLDALYTFIEDTVRAAGPKGEEILARWKGIQKAAGVDVRKDVLGWIEGDTVTVSLEGGKGSVFLLKVKDEEAAREKVRSAIEFLTTRLAELVREKPELMGLAMLGLRTTPVKHEALEGFQNLYFSMSPQPIVWGTAEGYLVFGSSEDAVALCLETARGKHPDIRRNTRAMEEAILPEGAFASVSLTDRRHLGREIQQGLGVAAMMTGMMGAFIPAPEVKPIMARISALIGKLAPVAEKIDFYKSKASLTTFDGRGWHTRSVTHYFSPEERAAEEEKGE